MKGWDCRRTIGDYIYQPHGGVRTRQSDVADEATPARGHAVFGKGGDLLGPFRGVTATRRLAAIAVGVCLWWGSAVAVADEPPPAGVDDDRWRLEAGVGVQQMTSRDQLGSPLMYRGMGIPPVLRLDKAGQRWSVGARAAGVVFGVNGGRLSSSMAEDGDPSHRADSVHVEFQGWLDREVTSSSSPRLAVGAQVGHWTFFRSYFFDPAQIGSVETWESTISADGRLSISDQLGRLFWRAGLEVALAGWMMRPAYAVRGDERVALVERRHRVLTEGRLTAVHRLQMVHAEGGLGVDIGDRWTASGRIRATWMNYRDERPTRSWSRRATIGIGYRF